MSAVLQSTATRQADDRERAMIWFHRHLWDLTGENIFKGVTMPSDREANVRRVIAQHGLAEKQLGRFNGRPEDYRAFARRALHIDLDVKETQS